MPIKHAFTSAIADGADATLVRPSNWNADHIGTLDAADITFTPATATDWNSSADPGDLDDALNQLAARVTEISGSLRSTKIINPNTLSDIAVWFDAGTLSSGNHGDPIGTWADQSGNNLNATQSTAESKPTLDKTTFANPSVYFSGNKTMSLTRPVKDDFTIFVIIASTNTDGASVNWYENKGIFGSEIAGVVNDWAVTWDGGTASFGTGNPDSSVRGEKYLANGLLHVISVQRQKLAGSDRFGGYRALFIDGVNQRSSRGGTNSLDAASTVYIGSLQSSSGYFTGWVAEIFATSTMLSDSTREGVENYYINKYSI